MSIFKKNPNEENYVGGKKHFTDVIKNTGSGELLIWRAPEEDFNTNSTLIVMPGEQAIFIKGGQIEQVFDNGTYKLSTENYPFIGRLRNALSGGISTFNCVVYFVRTAHSIEIKWGTDTPIQVRDKLLGIATKLRARGSYKVSIENPSIFLEKLVGNNIQFTTQEELNLYFLNEFQSKIKSEIAKHIQESNTEILGIDAHLEELSKKMEPSINAILNEYGLTVPKFTIAAIDIDDDEIRRRYDEIGMNSIEKLRNAQADKNVMDILGDDWARQQSANILSDLANNPGAGGAAAAGAGMGMGMSAGSVFGSMANQMFEPMNRKIQNREEEVSEKKMSRFAPKQEEKKEDSLETLDKLNKLLDSGLIEQSEYDEKKKEILGRM